MSKQPASSSYSSNSIPLINPEAFEFLSRCHDSEFDLTSAEPPHPTNTGIIPPPTVLAVLHHIDFADFREVKGMSRGDALTLENCSKFFYRLGISCTSDNVSLCGDILSGLELVYSTLGLPNSQKKILLIAPGFEYYLKQFQDLNISYDVYSTQENNYLPEEKDLEEALVRTGAKTILLGYPNNPTGTVMTEDCARMIARVTEKHGVFIISDEAFAPTLPLTEKKHFPIAAVEGVLPRSFTVTSPAKAMLGTKMAFCVGSPDILRSFSRLGGFSLKQQKIMTAAIADNDENREYLGRVRTHYLGNTQLIEQKLEELNERFGEQFGERNTYAKLFIARPESTNVLLLDFSGLRGMQHQRGNQGVKQMETGLDVAEWLLKDASVAMVPGECFLLDPKQMLVRITLNDSSQQLIQAFDRIIAATKSITADNSRSETQGSAAAATASSSSGSQPSSSTSCRSSTAIPLAGASTARTTTPS